MHVLLLLLPLFTQTVQEQEPTGKDLLELCKDNIHCDAETYCSSPKYSFREKKYFCGKTCGLCGKAPETCEDSTDCDRLIKKSGGCKRLLTLLNFNFPLVELHCGKTCGFCSNTTESLIPECKDTFSCDENYCNDPEHSFSDKKYFCGKTCGLCGKAPPKCKDSLACERLIRNSGGCRQLLNIWDNNIQLLEHHCSKTCGFCSNPF